MPFFLRLSRLWGSGDTPCRHLEIVSGDTCGDLLPFVQLRIDSSLSGDRLLFFCFTSSAWLNTFIRCSVLKVSPPIIITLDTPVMWVKVHAKTSMYLFKRLGSLIFILVGSFLPIVIFCSGTCRLSPSFLLGISPKGRDCSPEKPTRGVFESTRRDLIDGFSFKKQCSYITSHELPPSSYALFTCLPDMYTLIMTGSDEPTFGRAPDIGLFHVHSPHGSGNILFVLGQVGSRQPRRLFEGLSYFFCSDDLSRTFDQAG
ncbi:hypothetical protein Tco_0615559 [Tanacetum coccineum]